MIFQTQKGTPMKTTTRLLLIACLSLPVLAACQKEEASTSLPMPSPR